MARRGVSIPFGGDQGRGSRGGRNPGGEGKTTPRKGTITFDRSMADLAFKGARPRGVEYKTPEPEMRDANYALARAFQRDIVDVLEKKIRAGRRPQRSTQYLIEAIGSINNIDWDYQGFTVGIETFLDESPAGPYYRNLEYGSSVFIGRVIEGFFEDSSGRVTKARTGARNAIRLVQVGDFTNPIDTPAGRFASALPGAESSSARVIGQFPVNNARIKSATQLRYLHSRKGPAQPIIISNPIPAYAYFEEGRRKFLARASGPGGLFAQYYRVAAARFVDRGGLIIK